MVLPLALFSQHEHELHRFTSHVDNPLEVKVATNAGGWTASLVVESGRSHFRIFDKKWHELAYVEESNKEPEITDIVRYEYFLIHDKSRFGYLAVKGNKPAQLVVVEPTDGEPAVTRHLIDVYKLQKGRGKVVNIGLYNEEGNINILWMENERSTTIHHTKVNLDGEASLSTFEPSDLTQKREAFKLNLFGEDHLLPFVDDRGLLPSNPFNGFRSNRLLNHPDKLCLIVDHVHRIMVRDHHAHMTIIDKKTGAYDSFFLPYDGTSFIMGDSLFLFNAEQDFKTYSFSIRVFSVNDIFKRKTEAKPIYELKFDDKTKPEFPIPFLSLQELRRKSGHYELTDNIDQTSTKDIINSMLRINSRPFLTMYPEGDQLHLRLGLISFSEGVVMIPSVSVYYLIIGKQIRVMDLAFDPEQSRFNASDFTSGETEWDKYSSFMRAQGRKLKDYSRFSSTFQRNGLWYVAYQNPATQKLEFKQL